MSQQEFETIKAKYGFPKGARQIALSLKSGAGVVLQNKSNENCPYLSEQGACTVYDLRPRVCRDYGVIPEMPCMVVTPEKATTAFDEMVARMTMTL